MVVCKQIPSYCDIDENRSQNSNLSKLNISHKLKSARLRIHTCSFSYFMAPLCW
jgi:hypothetical protein